MPYTLMEALIAVCALLLMALIGSFSQPVIHVLWDALTLNQRRNSKSSGELGRSKNARISGFPKRMGKQSTGRSANEMD